MKIKSLFPIFFMMLHMQQSSALQKGDSLSAILPEDTFLTIELDNLTDIKSDMSEGPWGKVADFPIWQKISKWIDDELNKDSNKKDKFNDVYERLFQPIMDSLNGAMIFGFSDLENLMVNEQIENANGSKWKAQKMPFTASVFESSLSEEGFQEMISFLKTWKTKKKSRFSVIEEKIGKVKIFWVFLQKNEGLEKLNPKSTGFCLSLNNGKLYFLTGDVERVESIFERQKGADVSLLNNDSYIDCFDEIGKGNARMFINFNQAIHTLQKMRKEKEFEIPQNPFGINMDGLIKGLGLDGLEFLGLQLNCQDENFELSSFLGLSERNGILSLLAPVEGDLEFHNFVSEDVFSVSNARQDLFEIWPRFEKILKDMSPGLHLLVTSQIQAFEDQAEVAVRDDLLGSLGSEFISLSYLNEGNLGSVAEVGPSSAIYAIGLKDPQLFDRTMRAVLDSVSQGNELFQDREHRGVTIRSMRGLEGAGLSLSYAIANDWLLLSMGKARYMNQVINKMEDNKNSLWNASFMKDALDDLPSGIRQTDYVDFRELFSFFQILSDTVKDDDFKFSSEDFGEFPYFMFGWSKDIDLGIVSKVRMYPFKN